MEVVDHLVALEMNMAVNLVVLAIVKSEASIIQLFTKQSEKVNVDFKVDIVMAENDYLQGLVFEVSQQNVKVSF